MRSHTLGGVAVLAASALMMSTILTPPSASAATPAETSTSAHGWYVTGQNTKFGSASGTRSAGAAFTTVISYSFPSMESGITTNVTWTSNAPGTLVCNGVLSAWTTEKGIPVTAGTPVTYASTLMKLGAQGGACTLRGTIPVDLVNQGARPVENQLTLSSPTHQSADPRAEIASTTVQIDTVAPNLSVVAVGNTTPYTKVPAGEPFDQRFTVTNTTPTLTLTQVGVETAVEQEGMQSFRCESEKLAPQQSTTCVAQMLPKADTDYDIAPQIRGWFAIDPANEAKGGFFVYPEIAHAYITTKYPGSAPKLTVTVEPMTRAVPGFAATSIVTITNSGEHPFTSIGALNDPEVVCSASELAVKATMTCAVTFHPDEWGTTYNHPFTLVAATSEGRKLELPVVASVTTYAAIGLVVSQQVAPVVVPAGHIASVPVTVTNIGTLPIRGISSDTSDSVVCPKDALAPGESMICTVAVPTPAGKYSEQVKRDISLSGYSTDYRTVRAQATAYAITDRASASFTAVAQPASRPGVPDFPRLVDLTVTNTGQAAFTGFTSADPDVTCPAGTLAPGATITCTVTFHPTQYSTTYTKEATLVGTTTDGRTVEVGFKAEMTTYARIGMYVSQSAGTAIVVRPGDTAMVPIILTNDGELQIMGIASDTSDVVCPKGTLDPGESMTCTVSVATKPDVLGADYARDFTISGYVADYRNVSAQATAHAFSWNTIGIVGVQKETATPVEPGTTARVPVTVSNIGGTAIANISSGPGVVCEKTTLAPAESMVCTVEVATEAGKYSTEFARMVQISGYSPADGRTTTTQVNVTVTTAPQPQTPLTVVGNIKRYKTDIQITGALADGSYRFQLTMVDPRSGRAIDSTVNVDISKGKVIRAQYLDPRGSLRDLPKSAVTLRGNTLQLTVIPWHAVVIDRWGHHHRPTHFSHNAEATLKLLGTSNGSYTIVSQTW